MDDEESTPFWPMIASSNTGADHPLVANLVEESPQLPGAVGTVINTKRRRLIIGFGALSLVAIVALVTSLAVYYTRPDGKSAPTLSPSFSLEPSRSPSLFPSASPSTDLFGFLAGILLIVGMHLRLMVPLNRWQWIG